MWVELAQYSPEVGYGGCVLVWVELAQHSPSSMRLGVVGVECRKLVLIRASCPRRPLRVMSKGLWKLLEVVSSSFRDEPMARLIPLPSSTLEERSEVILFHVPYSVMHVRICATVPPHTHHIPMPTYDHHMPATFPMPTYVTPFGKIRPNAAPKKFFFVLPAESMMPEDRILQV